MLYQCACDLFYKDKSEIQIDSISSKSIAPDGSIKLLPGSWEGEEGGALNIEGRSDIQLIAFLSIKHIFMMLHQRSTGQFCIEKNIYHLYT